MEGYAPFIRTFPSHLSSDLCETLIATYEADKDGQVPGKTFLGLDEGIKKTTDVLLSSRAAWKELDTLIFRLLGEALKAYADAIPQEHDLKAYLLNGPLTDSGYIVQKYKQQDGFYAWHNDFDVRPDGRWRVLTFLWYLNDVELGGETEFIDGTKIKPEAGKLLLFPSTWSLKHRGAMPISCDKYILTGWMYCKCSMTVHERTL